MHVKPIRMNEVSGRRRRYLCSGVWEECHSWPHSAQAPQSSPGMMILSSLTSVFRYCLEGSLSSRGLLLLSTPFQFKETPRGNLQHHLNQGNRAVLLYPQCSVQSQHSNKWLLTFTVKISPLVQSLNVHFLRIRIMFHIILILKIIPVIINLWGLKFSVIN